MEGSKTVSSSSSSISLTSKDMNGPPNASIPATSPEDNIQSTTTNVMPNGSVMTKISLNLPPPYHFFAYFICYFLESHLVLPFSTITHPLHKQHLLVLVRVTIKRLSNVSNECKRYITTNHNRSLTGEFTTSEWIRCGKKTHCPT